ncbi:MULTISPECIES: HNH endonuclease signature motif containing protein, partial [unclassified Nocardiopsis]|uniref:HNH endonuclease signature motif containing protein n=2 Tax=Nocardiopsidaceae TaxID=83676 RepID=UPI00387B5714
LLPDRAEKDHARADAERGARLDVTFGGSFLFQAWGSAADAVLLRACLDSYTPPPDPDEADTPGGTARARRTYEAFTTALGLAHTHHGCAQPDTPIVRVQVSVPDTVLAGDTTSGTPVTDTGQALPLSVLRAWLTRATVRPLFTDHNGTATHVGEERRLASPGMRAAAFARHTACAWPTGCDRPLRWCQADHIVEFFQGGPTRADNLQPLCAAHNRIKHRRTVATERRRFWTGRPTRPPATPAPPAHPEPLPFAMPRISTRSTRPPPARAA